LVLFYNYNELSIDSLYEDYGFEIEEKSDFDTHELDLETQSSEPIDLKSISSDEHDISYLENIIHNNEDLLKPEFAGLINENTSEIQHRLNQIKTFFPDGLDQISKNIDSTDPVNLFKLHYIGIISDFPPLFLADHAEKKIIQIIKYIQSQLKGESIEDFTLKNDLKLLNEYKLKNIARYVNYSWNKLIHIVYPNQFNPWQLGKVEHGYWEVIKNRQNAVKWIVEEYLNTNPDNIWRLIKDKIYNRRLYGKLGLSYLYNTHYNSLFKSLNEAYPDLPFYKLGLFPDNFWNNSTNLDIAKQAFKWMLVQERIDFDEIPLALKTKRLTRHSFNQYGLSTMFDYCFNRNFYELIDSTFPDKFKPWEVGNVKQSYWENVDHQRDAIYWFIKEQDTSKNEIFTKIESRKFSKQLFKTSKLANFFKTVFKNDPENVFKFILKPKRQILNENRRLLKRYEKESKYKVDRSILNFILYGFNLPIMTYFEKKNADRIKRKKRRLKRIFEDEF
jgi:hypothetical protein